MSDIDQHVGKKIRAHRILAGLSQGELGASIGVSFQQVQKYETGQNRISASRLCAIAARLNVPVKVFFDGISLVAEHDGQVSGAQAETDVPMDEGALVLARKASQLTTVQRRAISAMIDAMSNGQELAD